MATGPRATPLRVLFVCTHNSGRSQMAEAYLNLLGQGRFTAESAGLEPREMNPWVVQVMGEEGIDLSQKKPNKVFDFFREGRLYDYVIYLCDKQTETKCPVFPGIRRTLNWPFPDPATLEESGQETLERVREIRNQIKAQVVAWIRESTSHPAA